MKDSNNKKLPKRATRTDFLTDKPMIPGLRKNTAPWHNRLLVATPSTGNVRMEWVLARYSQIIPTNWSQVDTIQWMHPFAPTEYLLPDAENLIANQAVLGGFEWLLFIEEDNVLPPDAFSRINEYIIDGSVPIVAGAYFTKSHPAEPVMYRGRGNGSFQDWKLGDKVWVDGVPFGFTLIHGSILKALWDESEEYMVAGEKVRRVFHTPARNTGDPNKGEFSYMRGTSDLEFCTRIMENKIFDKAGWSEFQKMKFPFLVDTGIYIQHIDRNGRMYPLGGLPPKYHPKKEEVKTLTNTKALKKLLKNSKK